MKRKLIVLLGPTASGKTNFSIELAKWITRCHPEPFDNLFLCHIERSRNATQSERAQDRLRRSATRQHGSSLDYARDDIAHHDTSLIEIINADSRQLYKYMDVGTAKIRPEEMCGIPHHLFSVLDPKDKVTVGWYKDKAEQCIEDILIRGHIPVLVGGSMLYISAITDGYVLSGRGRKQKVPVPYDVFIMGMEIPRSALYQRINERTKTLLTSGWIKEVRHLLGMGYGVGDPGFEACGYREIASLLCHPERSRGISDGIVSHFDYAQCDTLCAIISTKTRQYAKRQMTWWRHDKRIRWVTPEAADFESLVADLRVFFGSSSLPLNVPQRADR